MPFICVLIEEGEEWRGLTKACTDSTVKQLRRRVKVLETEGLALKRLCEARQFSQMGLIEEVQKLTSKLVVQDRNRGRVLQQISRIKTSCNKLKDEINREEG